MSMYIYSTMQNRWDEWEKYVAQAEKYLMYNIHIYKTTHKYDIHQELIFC